jgi:class 3 adenylate cyclase
MRISLIFLFLLPVSLSFCQSVEVLEKQLSQTSDAKEKMMLNYQLGKEWLRTDARKSIDFAKAAHQKALELRNNGMAAEAAYLVSSGYGRTNDDRNEDIWLGSAIKFAMDANDADLIIKTVDLRSRLAVKNHNERKALQVVQEAFTYFSNKGGKSISEMQAQYEIQKNLLEREKRQLEAEKKKLENEMDNLQHDRVVITTERDNLKEDKTVLAERQRMLEQEKQLVEEEITKKEVEIQTVSTERAKALYIAERRRRLIDSLETRKTVDSLALEQKDLALHNAELEKEQGRYLTYLLGVGSIFTVLLAFMFYLRFLAKKKSSNLLSKQNKIIEEERQRSDELLYNIMPVEVARELKEKGAATAQQFPEATVLFTDFKNFTTIAERLSPEQLVNELNDCFRAFDHIISQYPDIEKIKTIGDAYLCASGLVKHKTIPKNILQAALEMQEFLEDHKKEKMRLGLPCFEARIGIHTGPVVAGVVGFKKFAYDIWGDTVNIAARMEEQCESGQVNISETTYGLIKYNFVCQSRGKVPVKNKGMMEMYYVIRSV